MINDYFNPNSMNPGNGWKPQGFLGGMQYAQQDMQYQDAMELQKKLTLEHLAQQTMQNEVYRQKDLASAGAQGRAQTATSNLSAQVDTARMNDPNYAGAMVRGDIGKANEQYAKGELATTDLEGDKTLKTMENRGKMWAQTADNLANSMAVSPIKSQTEWNEVRKSIPPQLQQRFPEQFDPSIPERLKAMSVSVMNTVSQRQKMEAEREKLRSAEKIGEGNNKATMYAADQRRLAAGARVKTLLDNFQAAKTPEQMMMYGEILLQDPELDPQVQQQVQRGVEQARRIQAERMARGQFDLSNPTGGTGGIAADLNQRLTPNAPFGGSMNIPGVGQVQVLSKNPDGSIKFKAANGRTGTYRPQGR